VRDQFGTWLEAEVTVVVVVVVVAWVMNIVDLSCLMVC
jgi:hypothetical protein